MDGDGNAEMANRTTSPEPQYPQLLLPTLPPPQAFVLQLAQSIIRPNAKMFLAEHYKSILDGWVFLLRHATLPNNTTNTDDAVISAFQTLDAIILARNSASTLLSRLAYVLLLKLHRSLEAVVRADIKKGRIKGEQGYRSISIVYDIYTNAQLNVSAYEIRAQLLQRLRIARRWALLAGDFPIMLLVHSKEADNLIGTKLITHSILQAVAQEVTRLYPIEVVQAVIALSNIEKPVSRPQKAYSINELERRMRDLTL